MGNFRTCVISKSDGKCWRGAKTCGWNEEAGGGDWFTKTKLFEYGREGDEYKLDIIIDIWPN